MKISTHDWTVLLAGGTGTRLRGWVGPDDGGHIPKPYRRLVGGAALLDQAVARARNVVPACRLVLVVSAEHETFWRPRRADLPGATWLVQPGDRGTGVAILSALSFILLRDPEATLTIMPVDQAVDDEKTFLAGILKGRRVVKRHPQQTILFGCAETEVDDGYGWIVPGEALEPNVRRVTRFVGQSDAEESRRLRQSGALVDTFLLVGSARGLLAQFRRTDPELIDGYLASLLDAGPTPASLMRLQVSLPTIEFGRWFLESAAARGELAVATLPSCGWADVGTPERVLAWLDRYSPVKADGEVPEAPARDDSSWTSPRS